jgi:aerotaxis receptor
VERNTELAHSATRAAQDLLGTARQLQTLNRAFQLHRRA